MDRLTRKEIEAMRSYDPNIEGPLTRKGMRIFQAICDLALQSLSQEAVRDEALAEILDEVQRATSKFPTWPTDPLHALAVLGEEFGELTKAMLQLTYEPDKTSKEEVRKEALQTAAMAYRLYASLDRYDYKRAQHEQTALKREPNAAVSVQPFDSAKAASALPANFGEKKQVKKPLQWPEPSVPEGEQLWLIERTYAKGEPAERREFWLGGTTDVHNDSFYSGGHPVWTTDALKAARFPSQDIAATLRYRYFHPECTAEVCGHMFQCGISPERPPSGEMVMVDRNTLGLAHAWLRAAIECKDWHWDGDQHEAATEIADELKQLLSAAEDEGRKG